MIKHSILSAHLGLIVVGIAATIALLLEIRLAVPQDVHNLLQFLWVAVVMGSLFIEMLQPILKISEPAEKSAPLEDIPEWRDSDRLWLQLHPDEQYPANDADKQEA